MPKKVRIISTSYRGGSNSDILAKERENGAREAGRMKTLLDRLNPLYSMDYAFREIYMIATAAEKEEGI